MEQGVYTTIGQERKKGLKGFVGMKELNKFYGRFEGSHFNASELGNGLSLTSK